MTFVVAGVPLLLAGLTAALLALIVFAHGPGRTVNRCLSVLLLAKAALALGTAIAAFTSGDRESLHGNTWLESTAALSGFGILAVPLALSWPARRRWAPAPAASLWPYAAAWILLAWCLAIFDTTSNGRPHTILSMPGFLQSVGLLMWAAQWAVTLLLIVEARRAAPGPLREGRILLAIGLSLLAVNVAVREAASIGSLLDRLAETGSIGWLGIVPHLMGVVATGVLTWHLWRIRESHAARVARWLISLAVLSGIADPLLRYADENWSSSFVPGYETRFFLYAFWMLAPTLLLAYIVLRGQIEGLDVKVHFAISKSTIAAAFVAAFFVASEGAQILFGAANEWVGLLAAGALVFAIAPLQRAAERLAQKAVPVVHEHPALAEANDAYRRHVEIAWSDGRMGAKERLLLQEVRASLRVSLDDADRIEREVARRSMTTGGESE